MKCIKIDRCFNCPYLMRDRIECNNYKPECDYTLEPLNKEDIYKYIFPTFCPLEDLKE